MDLTEVFSLSKGNCWGYYTNNTLANSYELCAGTLVLHFQGLLANQWVVAPHFTQFPPPPLGAPFWLVEATMAGWQMTHSPPLHLQLLHALPPPTASPRPPMPASGLTPNCCVHNNKKVWLNTQRGVRAGGQVASNKRHSIVQSSESQQLHSSTFLSHRLLGIKAATQ